MQFKEWIKCGYQSENLTVMAMAGEDRLLGLCWDSKRDILYFKVHINFSSKRCGKRLESDIELHELKDRFPKVLTKRNCLSITNSIFDPLGLIQPMVLKLKLALRDIILFK